MSLRELPSAFRRLALRDVRVSTRTTGNAQVISIPRRRASQAVAAASEPETVSTIPHKQEIPQDMEQDSSLDSTTIAPQRFDPLKRANARRNQLPPSRYQFRSPRYYRGPLHPHQPPSPSDPASRLFVPGPFEKTRIDEAMRSHINADLMTLMYAHKPPGTVTVPKADRLRSWDGSSPYHKNRPKRGPRGGDVLRLIEKDVDWRTLPSVKEITLHCFVKGAIVDSAHLHVAGMLLQSITGVKPVVHKAKDNVAQFGIRKDTAIGLTVTMKGNDALTFLDKCVTLVFPKIKDWPGVQGSSGDSSGNIAWGIDSASSLLFPEVEVNYDMYPPKMIPGFHVICKTTARSDRHARLLLSALGVPFCGKLVD